MTSLVAAIVGCGAISVNHANAFDVVDGVHIAAVVDPKRESADRLADHIEHTLHRPRPRVATSVPEAVQVAGPLDLVIIGAPSGRHYTLTEEALDLGIHVLIEKPLDVDMTRGRAMAALALKADQAGLVCSVVSQHRFDPASIAIAKAAHTGSLGQITSAVATVAWWRSQEYYDSGAWRGTWALDGGGALMNQGVHTVDLLLWFLGTPVTVFAHTACLAHEDIEVEDVAAATIRFESGALATLLATTAAAPNLATRIQVHGSRGLAVLDGIQLVNLFTNGGTIDETAHAVPPEHQFGHSEESNAFAVGHARQFADVVAAIRDRRAPGVTVTDALQALALVRAVYVSATLGCEVAYADVLSGAVSDTGVRTETEKPRQ